MEKEIDYSEYVKDIKKINEMLLNTRAEDSRKINNLLMKFDLNKSNVILNLGINPSEDTDEACQVKSINDEDGEDSILFIKPEFLEEGEKELLNIFNNIYIYTKGYHRAIYDLFENINAKAHWAQKGYLSEDKITEMCKKCNSKITEDEVDKIKKAIKAMQTEENKRTGPYIVYSDLIWYSCKNQNNLKKVLKNHNKDELQSFYKNIKDIIDIYIAYYNKPKMIVITNAYASDLVKEALKDKAEEYKEEDNIIYNGVPIIFCGMVSGKHPMDKYSRIRLARTIEKIYNNRK